MKHIPSFILSTAACVLLIACKPDLKGELGTPSDKVEGINGTWEIATFSQQDPNNPIREERDLSEFYVIPGETPTQLTFDKTNRTYTVQAGAGKNFFGDGGSWGFDNDEYPTYLMLYTPTDTIQTLLGSVVRPTDTQLRIQLENACVDAAGIKTVTSIYKFSFNRVN